MNRYLPLVIALLVGFAHAQDRSPEYDVLLAAEDFYGAVTGYAGEASIEVTALRMVLEGPKREATRELLQLLTEAKAGGQLYALCGLYLVDRPRFEQEVKAFLEDERSVGFCAGGDVVTGAKVRDLVRSSSQWAVRLPKNFAGSDWDSWVEAQKWPRHAIAEPDICGGALAVEVGRHKGFGAAGNPQGKLADWVTKLEELDDDDELESIVSEIAEFGKPALEAVRKLAASEDGAERRAAAGILRSMGAARLGPDADVAAAWVGKLLLDADAEIARGAAEALSELSPWIRSAHPAVVEALNHLPKRVAGGVDDEVLDYAAFLVEDLAGQLGERAVPGLVRIMNSDDEDIACMAGGTLGFLGPQAQGARGELMKKLRGPSADWALEALAGVGVEPDSAEARQIAALLRDPDLVCGAAEILGTLGPEAGPKVERALERALGDYVDDAEALGSLAEARWRITGKTDQLVTRLAGAGFQEVLVEVLKREPKTLKALGRCFSEGSARETALRAAAELGKAAAPVGDALRQALQSLAADHSLAPQAGRTLLAITGDSSFLVKVARQSLERDLRKGISLIRELGPDALPLQERLIERLLEGCNTVTRGLAMRALMRIGVAGAKSSVPYLEAQTADEQTLDTAIYALASLASEGSDLALDALKGVVEFGSERAQREAKAALEELTQGL